MYRPHGPFVENADEANFGRFHLIWECNANFDLLYDLLYDSLIKVKFDLVNVLLSGNMAMPTRFPSHSHFNFDLLYDLPQ